MILSHLNAATGAVFVETREEARQLSEMLAELPTDVEVCTMAAPGGPLKEARKGVATTVQGLPNGYQWLQQEGGRVLVVYDWHPMVNAPLQWRALIEALPGIRSPRTIDAKGASLVVFVGPTWELTPANPLKGAVPILHLAPVSREKLRETIGGLFKLNGEADKVLDALGGLDADVAEQAAAECLAAKDGWDPAYLRAERGQLLKRAGLELWPTTPTLGGLGGFKDYVTKQVVPWVRHKKLSVRRLLCAGLPGTGKSFGARWLAHQFGTECVRLSIPSLKAGIVGASETALRKALATIDSLSREAPLVVVIDEIDTIAREGMDGGTSSGMFAELLTWLQESKSMATVVATLNRLDKLDAALESRFAARFFYDLPTPSERQAVADIWFKDLDCPTVDVTAGTDGWSNREIAEYLVPEVARLTNLNPTPEAVAEVVKGFTSASKTQAEQLEQMKKAAGGLRRANDPEGPAVKPTGRRITSNR